MNIEVIRMADNGDTTMGALYINGIFRCFTIEDQEQKGAKVMHETRIPNGAYKIGLRNEGGFNDKYKAKYPEFHKGMLCIHNAPDWKIEAEGKSFQFILIHTGNTDEDTSGCLLVNFGLDGKAFIGSNSDGAYRAIYPEIAKAVAEGKAVTITYKDIEGGK